MVSRRDRPGKSTLGCLFTLLIVVAAGYFAFNVGEVYLRYYRFRDSMQQAASEFQSTVQTELNKTETDLNKTVQDVVETKPEADKKPA